MVKKLGSDCNSPKHASFVIINSTYNLKDCVASWFIFLVLWAQGLADSWHHSECTVWMQRWR